MNIIENPYPEELLDLARKAVERQKNATEEEIEEGIRRFAEQVSQLND